MKIVLIGPPGSGKGSQSSLIEKAYNLPHISTGNMFRSIMKEKSFLGRKVRGYMDNHQLVPDEVAIEVVEKHLSKPKFKNGFILDGYPRTLKQAQELDKLFNIDVAILLDIKTDEIIRRIQARMICSNCGEIYNTNFFKGKFCLLCGNSLVQRKDDKVDIVLKRVNDYKSQTLPVVDYYSKQNRLKVINENCSIEKTFNYVKNFLEKVK